MLGQENRLMLFARLAQDPYEDQDDSRNESDRAPEDER